MYVKQCTECNSGSDDAMEADDDHLMSQWFDMVQHKNEFVREETTLMHTLDFNCFMENICRIIFV